MIGVILAADLRALAVIDAFAIGLEPGLVEAAGNRVDAHAERLDDEGMDHVDRRHLQDDRLVDGNHGLVVDRQQSNVAIRPV